MICKAFRLIQQVLTIKDFIRELAKSDLYRSLFFDNCSNIRAIELNFKHLLGRAPDSSQEISEHIAILTEGGFAAEIDSYLDSQEYEQNFGKDTVPYYISYETQTGKNVAGYNRIFQLIKGSCSSDRSIAASIGSSKRSQLQQSLLKKAEIKKPILFNPKGFDLAKALGIGDSQEPVVKIPASMSDPYLKAFADAQPIELITGDSVEKQELVIEAAYKQVFGNAHLMESERSPQIESQLRSGQITVMEFIRQLAKSERYRALFFDSCTNLRAIELNFKHLLGRAPENSAEISEHISLLAKEGFEAEIDSYLDSKVIKKSKYCLLKNEKDLNDEQKEKLKEIKELFPKLANMHRLKELLRNSFEESNSELIGLLNLSDWLRDAASDFANSSATIIRWLGEIIGYFKNRTTQGIVEGINNKLKLIKRKAYGFKNFDNFRLRSLLSF